jgi:BASS family bile acid:Na+ symporter
MNIGMTWTFADYEYALSAAIAVSTMIGMGTTLRPSDFWQVFRWPKAVLLTFALQLLAVPLLALLLGWVFRLPDGVALGLLFVAALPGGLYSNLYTHLGGGNGALSITATAIATLACPVTTVFVLKTYGALLHIPESIEMPVGRILMDVFVYLMLPLLLGMWGRRVWPKPSQPVGRWCIWLSVVLVAILIVCALLAGRLNFAPHGWRSPVAVAAFVLGIVWIGYGFGLLVRLPAGDLYTVMTEILLRNIPLGILLKARLFPATDEAAAPIADGVLFALLVYAGISLIVGIFEMVGHQRGLGVVYGRWARSAKDEVGRTKDER